MPSLDEHYCKTLVLHDLYGHAFDRTHGHSLSVPTDTLCPHNRTLTVCPHLRTNTASTDEQTLSAPTNKHCPYRRTTTVRTDHAELPHRTSFHELSSFTRTIQTFPLFFSLSFRRRLNLDRASTNNARLDRRARLDDQTQNSDATTGYD